MIHNLFAQIVKSTALTAADKDLCQQYFKEAVFTRNQLLEEQDKIPNYLYLICSGFMRLFYYDENGDEITTFLASPNSYIASFMSLINEKPAVENVECITDCEVLQISRSDMMELIGKSENFKEYSLTIFKNVMELSQIRANDLSTLTAELRYKKMMAEQPLLLQNIPVQYIASFLGIKPQSLSRIRRQIIP